MLVNGISVTKSAFALLLAIGLSASADSGQPSSDRTFRIRLFEVQPASLSSEQTCTLVFADHHFHHEKTIRKHGRAYDQRVYEGELSQSEWNALSGIIDSKEFRELNVPRDVEPLVIQDAHPYTISVAREDKFQNLEFLDNKSLKPYYSQVEPLLKWWKSLRGRHLPQSNAPADERCSPDVNRPLVSN